MCADVTVSLPAMMVFGEEDGIVQVCATLSAVGSTERDVITTLETNEGTGRELAYMHTILY